MRRDPGQGGRTAERLRLLLFVPSRRAATETFIRANLRGLPFDTVAVFGDEFSVHRPWQTLYAGSIAISKALTRLGLLRLATLFPSLVAWALCRRCRPAVLMAEFGFHAVRVMEVAAWTGLPLIVHFRGSDASAQDRLDRLRQRYLRLMRLVAGVVVKSEPMRQTLLELGAPPDRLIVSPSGADPERFHGARPAQAPPHFLSVGRFVAKKGPLLTLEAFALAARERPALRLWMVGEGPLLAAARVRAAELGIAPSVVFAGMRSPDWIAQRMRESRGFLQHSLTAPDGDCEGSPVAVMEAQLCGLPVVATRHGGIPEVVLDGRTGWLVDEGDVAAMARAIGRLADDPARAGTLGRAGRRRCASRFTVAHHLESLTALIDAVAGGRAGSSGVGDSLPP